MQFITDGFFQFLLFLYQTTGNLGWAIIVLTLIIRFILVPLTLPSLKAQKKIKDLQPEIDKLKQKHGKDKQAMQKAQLELYQKYNVNPLSGCLPQLVQLGMLIFLYQALISFLGQDAINGAGINPSFLWLDLTQPDTKFVLPVVAGVTQMVLSLMIAPGGETRDIVPNKSKSKKIQQENKKEENMAGMAASMQQQMLFIMPIMTVFIAARFPSGLAVYWVMTTVFSIGQQYFISGWGGLKTYYLRALAFLNRT
jgi:YidC/Oxa1 family membrane protein insertase